MYYLQLIFCLCVSVLKGAGSYFAFAIADQLVQLAYGNKGGWLICYAGAVIVILIGIWCIVESFFEFAEIIKAACDGETESDV